MKKKIEYPPPPLGPQSANHNKRRLLLSSTEILEASLTYGVDPDHTAHLGAVWVLLSKPSDLGNHCLSLYLGGLYLIRSSVSCTYCTWGFYT